jgi:hypothetical protein
MTTANLNGTVLKQAGRILHGESYTKGRRCISINGKMSTASHRVAKKSCALCAFHTHTFSVR